MRYGGHNTEKADSGMNAGASKTQLLTAFIGARVQAYLPADGKKKAFKKGGRGLRGDGGGVGDGRAGDAP